MRPPRAVLFVGLATAFSLLGDQMLYAVLPTYYEDLGLLPYQVGILLSINRWIRLLTNYLAALVCERYRLGLILGLALAAGALLTAVYGLFSSFAILCAARILWGICWSFIRQIGLMTVVDAAVEGNMGQLMGFYSGLTRMGSMSGNLLGAVGHDLLGFTSILVIFAGVSLLAVPFGALSRRGVQHSGEEKRESGQTFQTGWGLLFCAFVVGSVGQGLMMSTLGVMLKEAVGDSLTVGGISIGVASLTGVLLSSRWIVDLTAPLLGSFSDRCGRRWGGLIFFAAGGGVLGSVALVEAAAVLLVLVLVFYLCAAGVTVTLAAEAGSRGTRSVASYVTAGDLGAATGPMLGWLALQWSIQTEGIFGLGGGLYALAGLVAMRTFR